MVAKRKPASSGPKHWEEDDETFPRKMADCRVCGRHGEMKLASDFRGYLCLHAGKCIARASRIRRGEEITEP